MLLYNFCVVVKIDVYDIGICSERVLFTSLKTRRKWALRKPSGLRTTGV